MKSGNSMMDYAQALAENVLPTVQQGFAQVYASLLGLAAPRLNYSYLTQLIKDIEAPYNSWNKSIKILEDIADIEPTKLKEYKQNLQKIYDFGQDVCRLSGINIKELESSPNAQARLNELYTTYREGFLQLVSPMQQAYDDILEVTTIKDQRPIIEKYVPYIEMMVPEDRPMFIQSIEDNLRAGKNPVALELAYLTQIPQNVYRAIYPLRDQPPVSTSSNRGGNEGAEGSEDSETESDENNPEQRTSPVNQSNQANTNPEEEAMIQELKAQLEKITRERDQAVTERNEAFEQVAQREQAIMLLNNSIPQAAQLQRQIEENGRNLNAATQERDEAASQVESRDRIIEEKEQIISGQQEQIENLIANLTEEKATNLDLSSQLAASKAGLAPLQEKVAGLKIENQDLKEEKAELRAEKKSAV